MTDKHRNGHNHHHGSHQVHLKFDENELALNLFGPGESNLDALVQELDIEANARGAEVSLKGVAEKVKIAENVLNQLYGLLKKGYPVRKPDIERSIRIITDDEHAVLKDILLETIVIPAKKKIIYPKTAGQKAYIEAMSKDPLVFGIGPAGTGKTYLAMAIAVTELLKGNVERIILTRPAIEAGEKLGFLPGDLAEKVNPYLRPLYDALHDMVDFDKAQKMLERGDIEVAPLAFMRGRTLNDAFVILDEAQNCTIDQMRMFLTRIGFHSRVVVTGDVSQSDLPRDKKSGLEHAVNILKDVPGISFHRLTNKDVVRHPLVRLIIDAYEQGEKGL